MVEGMPFFNIATRYHVFFSHYFEFFGFYLWYTNANTHPFPSISIQVFNPSSFSSTDIHFHPHHLFVSSISSTVIHFHPLSMVNGHSQSSIFTHLYPFSSRPFTAILDDVHCNHNHQSIHFLYHANPCPPSCPSPHPPSPHRRWFTSTSIITLQLDQRLSLLARLTSVNSQKHQLLTQPMTLTTSLLKRPVTQKKHLWQNFDGWN